MRFSKKIGRNSPFSFYIVLDLFTSSGTTGIVALKYGRRFIGIELVPRYAKISQKRICEASLRPRLLV
ncbi:MAG: hypothetical protein J6O89_01905 [Aeriscardovia sp.]|nr:hypothetical protein [Aeriscardovia sp.]